MPFKKAEQKFSGKINECVIGVGDAAVTLGGEKGLPFLSGEGNAPVVGVEILDSYPEDWEKCLVDAYGDVVKDPAAWAKYVQDNTDAQFIALKLISADPNGANKSSEECVEIAKAVEAAIDLPLVVAG